MQLLKILKSKVSAVLSVMKKVASLPFMQRTGHIISLGTLLRYVPMPHEHNMIPQSLN